MGKRKFKYYFILNVLKECAFKVTSKNLSPNFTVKFFGSSLKLAATTKYLFSGVRNITTGSLSSPFALYCNTLVPETTLLLKCFTA